MAIPQDFADLLPGGSPGDVAVVFADHSTLVVLSGEVDLCLGPELAGHAQDVVDREAQVLIDLTALVFIDSTGLGFLARVAAAGKAMGRPPLVAGANRYIRESITMAGLAELVTYQD